MGLLLTFSATAQQQMGLHFMQPTLQSASINPALRPENHRWGINIMDYNTLAMFPVSYSQYLTREGGSRVLDMDALIESLDAEGNPVSSWQSFSGLGFGFQAKKWWFGLRSELCVDLNMNIPRDLLGVAWRGNAHYIGQHIEIGPSASGALYNSVNLQVNYEVTPKWTAGITAKYLTGIIGGQTTRDNMHLYTDTAIYAVSFQSDYVLQLGGFNPSGLYVSWDETTNSPNFQFQDSNIENGNGVGVDVGLRYRHDDKLTVNASLMNVGSISWENASEYTSNGTYTYNGIIMDDFVSTDSFNLEVNLDSLFDVFDVQATPTRMTYNLPSSFYLSGMYKIRPQLAVGALFQAERFNTDFSRLGAALHAQWSPNNWFQTGLTVGKRSLTPFTVGMHLMVKPGPVQLYVVTDNLIGMVSPINNNPSGMRVGMNLLFGRKWISNVIDTDIPVR